MRLTPDYVVAIKAATIEAFGANAVVRLFGSRLRDDARGGDIDLHVEVDEGCQSLDHAAEFRWRLFSRIEEQKVDVVLHVRGRPMQPIDGLAFAEGVIL